MAERSVRGVLIGVVRRLADAGVDSPRLDARVLLAHALGLPPGAVIDIASVADERLAAFEAFVDRRVAREPLAYITGEKEFYSLAFAVGPGVLIPRPETETLVDEALRAFPDRGATLRVLDLGTGSACLIVAFLRLYPNATGLGVDMSSEALRWAQRNVQRHGLSERCKLVPGNWNADGAFDVVFANPPYLTDNEFERAAPEIRRYEPRTALLGGCDGLASYGAIARELACFMKPEGLAFIEAGADQKDAIARILNENGLELHRAAPDLAGVPRCLIAGRRLSGGLAT